MQYVDSQIVLKRLVFDIKDQLYLIVTMLRACNYNNDVREERATCERLYIRLNYYIAMNERYNLDAFMQDVPIVELYKIGIPMMRIRCYLCSEKLAELFVDIFRQMRQWVALDTAWTKSHTATMRICLRKWRLY